MKNVKDVAIMNYTNVEGSFLDNRCNIVKHSQGRDDFGTICSQDDVVVEECTVLGPYDAGKPFSQCDPGGANLNIINCNVDKMEVKSTIGGTIITRGNKITSKLNALSEIKLNCVAILPKNKRIKNEESVKVLTLLMMLFCYQR